MVASNFRNRFRRRGFKKVAVGFKPKPKIGKRKYAPKMTFAKKVNQIIARNVENKFTSTLTYNDAVARSTRASSLDAFTFFNWSPGADATGSRLFNIQATALEGGRVGNVIKLKRWIIKGIIQPVVSNTTTLTNSNVGYVDVYFGRLLKNTTAVANTLVKLYQNGATTTTPTCISTDTLNPLNKDNYKVYYHKRFKMGAASDNKTYDNDTNTLHPANNDFKLSQTFGFDVCKYILKNKVLKFNDVVDNPTTPFAPPNNADIVNLTLWATYTPQTGSATGTGTSGNFKTLYNLDCLTYAEYEDA